MTQYHWNPLELLQQPQDKCYGVMKLNSRFQNDNDLQLFTNVWKHASLRCSADGGSNVLYHDVPSSHHPPTLPHFISGDFDSIKDDVKLFYENKGVEIIHTPDQNETDFTKCLRILLEKATKEDMKMECVVVHIGTSSRRLDHTISNINTLINHASHHIPPLPSFPCDQPSLTHHSPLVHNFSTSPSFHQFSTSLPSPSLSPSTHHPSFDYPFAAHHPFLFLIIGDSVTFILPPGTHRIASASPLRGKWCSLVPIMAPTTTTTRGLVYNMDQQLMSFGGLISTSNAFLPSSDHVFVENDQPLLFSMGVKF